MQNVLSFIPWSFPVPIQELWLQFLALHVNLLENEISAVDLFIGLKILLK